MKIFPREFNEIAKKVQANVQSTTSIIVPLQASGLAEFVTAVHNLSLKAVYISLPSLRGDLAQLDIVIEQFRASQSEMVSYDSSYTANMLASVCRLEMSLSACAGMPCKILQFLAQDMQEHFGKLPRHILDDIYDDLIAIITEDFQGMIGERWAMIRTAPEKFDQATIANHAAGNPSFVLHVVQRLEEMKKRYAENKIAMWLIEGLRKSANRGNYGFLNFPSFYKVSKAADGELAWTTLGWLAVKLGERDAVNVKLFGSGQEEWMFLKFGVQSMPRFISQLTGLRSAINNKINAAENLQTKLLGLLMSASIAVFQILAGLVTGLIQSTRIMPNSD